MVISPTTRCFSSRIQPVLCRNATINLRFARRISEGAATLSTHSTERIAPESHGLSHPVASPLLKNQSSLQTPSPSLFHRNYDVLGHDDNHDYFDRNEPCKSTSEPNQPEDDPDHRIISDMEWDLRVGRATFLLQSTIPDFFNQGLVKSSMTSRIHDSESPHDDPTEQKSSYSDEIIFAKNIRLSYTPPVPLPPPIPSTIHIEGMTLYQAVAVFVRTSMIALYSNLSITTTRFQTIQPPLNQDQASQSGAAPGPVEISKGTSAVGSPRRQKQLKTCMIVRGTSRLTGSVSEWDVHFTYTFSPVSGQIMHHQVDNIDPAPHSRVYDALRLSLLRIMGDDDRGNPSLGGVGGPAKLPAQSHVHTGCDLPRKK